MSNPSQSGFKTSFNHLLFIEDIAASMGADDADVRDRLETRMVKIALSMVAETIRWENVPIGIILSMTDLAGLKLPDYIDRVFEIDEGKIGE